MKRAPSEVGSDDEIDPEPAPSEPEKKTRIACTYGKKCFRSYFNIHFEFLFFFLFTVHFEHFYLSLITLSFFIPFLK